MQKSKGGFTLLEILIVLVIIAIMSAVVSLSVGSPRNRIFKSNLLKMSNMLDAIADQAVYTNSVIACKINDDGIACQDYKNGAWDDLNLQDVVPWNWPKQIQVLEIQVNGVKIDDDDAIRFPPNGEIAQISLHVTDGHSDAWIDGSLDGEFTFDY